METNPSQPKRVVVLYNTDYDAELKAASPVDVSAVQQAAQAACDAASAFGFAAELVGVEGPDLDRVIVMLRERPPDLVFNLVESLAGDTRNEIVVPALLDMLKVPYTGPGPQAIGLCLHKDRAKAALLAAGVTTPPATVLAHEGDFAHASGLDYPYFVKLVREDASIGIAESNVVHNKDQLERRSRELIEQYRQPVICERYIEGREVNVTVIGNGDDLRCLPLHEIDFGKMPADRPRIISYAAKWDEDHVDYEGTKPVPMENVSDALRATIETTAQAAFRALGLSDYGRVDLRVDADDRAWVIDVNPNCDISPDAGVARAARVAGMEYSELIGLICELAWRRYVDRNQDAPAR